MSLQEELKKCQEVIEEYREKENDLLSRIENEKQTYPIAELASCGQSLDRLIIRLTPRMVRAVETGFSTLVVDKDGDVMNIGAIDREIPADVYSDRTPVFGGVTKE